MSTSLLADNWVDVLQRRAQSEPDRTAMRFLSDGERAEQTVDYVTLARQSCAIAAILQQLRFAGERALVLCPPGLEFIQAFLGCLCAGAIAVPAPPPRSGRQDRSTQRLSGILRDCSPRVVLTTSPHVAAVHGIIAASGVVIEVIAVDTVDRKMSAQWIEPAIEPSAVACLQYTSGATRDPRGVILTHQNLLDNSKTIQEAFGHTPESRGLIWLPPHHDMGLIGGILQPLFAGFPVTLMSPQSFLTKPLRWLQGISRHRATTSGGPDFAYELAARTIRPEDCAGLDLSSWRVAFTGAEPIRPQTLDAFANAFEPFGFDRRAFFPCYGLAEATLLVSGVDLDAGASVKSLHGTREKNVVSCGRIRGGIEAIIVDPKSRLPVSGETPGEIWLRGGSVSHGYFNNSTDAFNATLADDDSKHYLRTGDLGFLSDDQLYVTGRLKDLIIIRGANHYPHDLEQTAEASHPALRAGGGAAFAIQHEDHEELAIVFEIERSYRTSDLTPVLDAIRQSIAQEHGIEIARIALILPGQLPRTSSGKTQRSLCRQMLANGELEMIAIWQRPVLEEMNAQPMDLRDLRGWLIARLAAQLNVPVNKIDSSAPLARYGLGSAVAVALAGEISDATGRDLPATLFWDYPSIDLLAEFLQSPVEDEAPPVGAL